MSAALQHTDHESGQGRWMRQGRVKVKGSGWQHS